MVFKCVALLLLLLLLGFFQVTGALQFMVGNIAIGCTPSTSMRLCTGLVPSRKSLIVNHPWKRQHSSWFETSRWATQRRHTNIHRVAAKLPMITATEHKLPSGYIMLHNPCPCPVTMETTRPHCTRESKVYSACLSLLNDLISFCHTGTGNNTRPAVERSFQDKGISSYLNI